MWQEATIEAKTQMDNTLNSLAGLISKLMYMAHCSRWLITSFAPLPKKTLDADTAA